MKKIEMAAFQHHSIIAFFIATYAYVNMGANLHTDAFNKSDIPRGTSNACYLDSNKFMKASLLRDCLTSLGGNPAYHQIEYIEMHFGHEEYLTIL